MSFKPHLEHHHSLLDPLVPVDQPPPLVALCGPPSPSSPAPHPPVAARRRVVGPPASCWNGATAGCAAIFATATPSVLASAPDRMVRGRTPLLFWAFGRSVCRPSGCDSPPGWRCRSDFCRWCWCWRYCCRWSGPWCPPAAARNYDFLLKINSLKNCFKKITRKTGDKKNRLAKKSVNNVDT